MTLAKLREKVLPLFYDPIPHDDTLRVRFAGCRQQKANPQAKRGGGPIRYNVADVEKQLHG